MTAGSWGEEEADLGLSAHASVRSLRFEKVPKVETSFRGDVSKRSFSASRRRNLPEEVREGAEYRDVEIERRDSGWIEDGEEDR